MDFVVIRIIGLYLSIYSKPTLLGRGYCIDLVLPTSHIGHKSNTSSYLQCMYYDCRNLTARINTVHVQATPPHQDGPHGT